MVNHQLSGYSRSIANHSVATYSQMLNVVLQAILRSSTRTRARKE